MQLVVSLVVDLEQRLQALETDAGPGREARLMHLVNVLYHTRDDCC